MFSKLLLERFYLTKLLFGSDYKIKLFYLTRTIPLIQQLEIGLQIFKQYTQAIIY